MRGRRGESISVGLAFLAFVPNQQETETVLVALRTVVLFKDGEDEPNNAWLVGNALTDQGAELP